ncbi:DNA polymerase III subunit gamma and tau, partial [Streptomyces sp. NPDC059597]
PTAAPAGGGGAQPQSQPQSPSRPQQQPQTPAVAPQTQAPAPAGGLDPRVLWPNILEAVKNRRRFTWILLSQNAQVAGFDGTTLQIAFVNAGARDTFTSGGSEDVLRQALAEQFNVQWKIDAVVDPSGGGSAPPPGPPQGYGSAPAGGYGAPAAAPRPAAPSLQPATQQQPSAAPEARPPAPAAPAPTPAPVRHVSPEDDTPEDDDPDLDESALSGRDLIVRELGATVVEEISNDQ